MGPGDTVRLKADPGRKGVLTSHFRQRGEIKFVQVIFPDGPQFIPEDQLEPDQDLHDPIELLVLGKLGRSADLRQNLTHIRLSGRLANLIYSMDTTHTDFYPYQFKPVIRFLESPGNGILIADEVGLGKTIEAGLIWTELRARIDARRLMVVCPAMLREKWQLELRNRFGIDAQILNAKELLTQLETSIGQGPYANFAIISSLQGIRPGKGWRKEEDINKLSTSSRLARFLDDHSDEEPLIDLLIIDEAHYMRNRETVSAELGRLLRHVSEHVILLSATPVHLRNQDLYQLLNLVDEDTFNQPLVFDSILEANAPLIRLREQVISHCLSSERFIDMLNQAREHPYMHNNRQLLGLLENPPTDDQLADREYRSELAFRLETMNLLGNIVNRTRKREVTEWRVIREAIRETVTLSEVERQFYDSVTNLVRDFCGRYQRHEGFLLVMPQRQIASSMPAALREWQRRGEEFESLMFEDLGAHLNDIEQPGPIVQEIITRAHELGDLDELWKNDSKFNRLVEVLKKLLTEHPEEKIVLFSYFRPTLLYLYERLEKEGFRCTLLMGGPDLDKNAILKDFQNPVGPNVLLSSEVASEGIDLQFCRVLINYDLPWNPMRVEQRIGRIDRLGQKSPKILVWNILAKDTIDEKIYSRLYARLEIFERALGGLEAVLGDEIRKLTMDLLSSRLTAEQEDSRIEQTAQALVNIRKEEERLEEESAKLIAHGDYIINQVRAARELNRWITAHDLWIYVRDFLQKNYPGCEIRQVSDHDLVFDIDLSNKAKYDLREFLEQERISHLTRLTRSVSTPVRCRFENRVSVASVGREEIISQFHPFIRFVSKKINSLKDSYYPAVSLSLSQTHCPMIHPSVYVFSIQRWSLRGIQERERLFFAATSMENVDHFLSENDAERLVTTAAVNGIDWLAASNLVDLKKAAELAERCLSHSYKRYEQYVAQLEDENNDRADIQENALDRHLTNQITRLQEVKDGHLRTGRDSLAKATEGKMQALKNRIEMKKMEINKRRSLQHKCEELCVGLIQVI
ncbi:MAG: DEAD/DEAH box helicase [Deltaproteobacteria bacterium]|nr:DEAD/DEAH box helicase [Deltaproteobacteria bacterium]